MGIKSRGMQFISRNLFVKGRLRRQLSKAQSNQHWKRVISFGTYVDWSYG